MSKVGHGRGGHGISNHWDSGFEPEKHKKALAEEAIVLVDGQPKVIKISLTDAINTKKGINAADYQKAKCIAILDDDENCGKGCGNGKKVGHHRKEAAAAAEEAEQAEQAKAEEEAKAAAEEAKQEEIKAEQVKAEQIEEEKRDDIKQETVQNDFRREDLQDTELRKVLLKNDTLQNEVKTNELNFKTLDLKKTKPRSVKSSYQTPVSNNANTNAVKTEFSDSSVHTSISHRDIEGELKKERLKSA